MMRHAVSAVPFYQRLGISAASITSARDLERFPVISKRTLQENPQGFLAQGYSAEKLHSSRTSGSTGEPTVTWFDDDAWALSKYALKIRRTLAVTTPFRHRCLIVSEQSPHEAAQYGRERPFRGGWLYSERVVSLFEDLSFHRRQIRGFRPDMLYAFPSYFLELLRSFSQAGETIPRIPLLFTSSELLTPAARQRIESGFGGRLFDIYGTTEFKEVAWQCRSGSYHVNFESVFVEAPPGADTWHLTTLCNRAMPLLRFNTEDLGALEEQRTCDCGRASPRLQISYGREADILELPGGHRLSPYMLTVILETLPGLHQYRIIHEAPARVTVEIVASTQLTDAAMDACCARLIQNLPVKIDLMLRRVASLERGTGGKHKAFERRW